MALEKRIISNLGLIVEIDQKAKGGRVIITYKSLDQLDELIGILGQRYVRYSKD